MFYLQLSPAVTTEQNWWGPTTEDTVTGSITVESNGLPADVSVLSVNLEGLAAKGDGYHVHQYPLNTRAPGDNVCGTTGGHFNPFSEYSSTCINLMCDVVYQPEVTKRDKTDIQAKSHLITP